MKTITPSSRLLPGTEALKPHETYREEDELRTKVSQWDATQDRCSEWAFINEMTRERYFRGKIKQNKIQSESILKILLGT